MKPLFSVQLCSAICSLFLVSTAFAQSSSRYVDPQQRFAIQLAPGWLAHPDSSGNGGVTIAREAGSYLLILVEKGTDPDDLLSHVNSKSEKQFPGYQISKRDNGTLAGYPSKSIFALAKPPNGVGSAVVNIKTFTANGFNYCALYYSSGDNLADPRMYQDVDTEESMLATLTVGPATASSVPAAAPHAPPPSSSVPPSPQPAPSSEAASTYTDPQQRFSIQVQPGWLAKSFDSGGASGVTIVHGADAYVQVLLQKGTDPATFLKSLNDNMQLKIPGYHITDRGSRVVSGHPSSFIMSVSQEPSGSRHTVVYLETFAANGMTYAVISSSNGNDLVDKRMLADFNLSQDMIHTLTVNPVSAQNSAPAPPAPAKTSAPPAKAASAVTSNSPAALSPADKKKLDALDAALKSGVLTKDEFEAKKNALYAGAQAQQANAAKLEALDQAYKNGILNKEEYERKKKELSTAPPPPTQSWDQKSNPNGSVWKPVDDLVIKSTPQSGSASNSLSTHNDPAGFAVDLPASWTVGKDTATGAIVLRGTRGEQVIIWPLFLEHVSLDTRGAGVLLQQLARKVDPQMPWGSVQTVQNVLRVIASSGQRSGAAMLSWAGHTAGTSAYLYCVEAPTDVYRTSTDSFVAILRSFHIVQDPSIKNSPGPANGAEALSFVSWTDPHEGAFNVAVPQGWQVNGGAYRLSATDIRYALTMASPDGQVRATVGDSNIGLFTQPTSMLAMGGLREGSYQALGDGTKLEIRQLVPGQQFALSYVRGFVSRYCSGLQITSNSARQDLAATFSQSARNDGLNTAQLTAGDVKFTCNLNGKPVQGKYVAATIPLAPGRSPMWAMYRLYGYLATPDREQEAQKVVTQAIQSWKFNPQWEAQQKGTANAALQQDNMRSQQIRDRALQAIAEDQRHISETITKGWEQRQKVYDEVDRRRENAILGTLDVIDPQTGAQYKVSNFGDYHYMTNDGYIISTNSPNSPPPNVREMITLPY